MGFTASKPELIENIVKRYPYRIGRELNDDSFDRKDALKVPMSSGELRYPHYESYPREFFFGIYNLEAGEDLDVQRAVSFSLRAIRSVPEFRAAVGQAWPSTPDAAHNAAVEAAAIAFVRDQLGVEDRDRQKDNCGWDLEYVRDLATLCVEVKGLAGSAVAVELTPNEYAAMKRAIDRQFPEGAYRLAVVCNALTAPSLFLFSHVPGTDWDWVCERTSRRIRATERVAARLAE